VVPSSFRILRRMLSQIEDEVNGPSSWPELQGAGIPTRTGPPHRTGGRVPDSAAPVVDGFTCSRRPCRSPRGPHWGAALEVTGADGLPKPQTGQRAAAVDDAQVSLRLPPDVRCAGGDRCPDLGHPDRRRAQRDHRHGGGGRRVDRSPLEPGIAATLSAVSRERFGGEPGFVGEGGSIPFLATQQRGSPARSSWRPVSSAALQRPRAQRVPPYPDGQGRDTRRRRVAS